jgi:phenylacetate-coenzyme A ligase PaaK-like adenylate-forming protein
MLERIRNAGKRRGKIRLLSSRPKSMRVYEESRALLCRPPAAYEAMMQQTLNQALERAQRIPFYKDHIETLQEIRSIEDLQSGFYTSSKKFTGKDPDAIGWDALISDESPVFLASTSGTSGSSKFIPYSQRSFDHNVLSSAPYIAYMTMRHKTEHQPTVLALSAPDRFITWHIMPKLFLGIGYNVVHVTLSDFLQDPDLVLDLIDHLLARDVSIDAIVCLGSMLPHFLGRLSEFPNGNYTVEKLRQQVNYVVSGGTEMASELEAMIKNELDLEDQGISNFFASTEAGVMAGSIHDFTDLYPSLHFQTPVLIPIEELEKETSNPGYTPKGVLATRAPVGTVGELAVTVNQMIPWINLRSGDVFEVTGLSGDYFTVPRLRSRSDLSSLHDLGGAKVKPHEYKEIVQSLGGGVTDYLAMSLKANEVDRSREGLIMPKDRLVFFYEGEATLNQVEQSLFNLQKMISVVAKELRLLDVLIIHVNAGTLAGYRLQKSLARNGAPGPLKHKAVKGPQYEAQERDIIERRLIS